MFLSKHILSVILLLGLLSLLPYATTQAASPQFQKSAGLFTDAGHGGNLKVQSDPTIVRSRLVQVNFNLLGGAAEGVSAAEQAEVKDVVTLNLFDDVIYTAQLDRIEPIESGGYAWIGHIDGELYSQVIFVVNQGQTAGNVFVLSGFYGIRYVADNTHAIYQIEQAAFPDDIVVPVSVPAAPPIQALADNGSQIDVMVLYTGATRQAAGGVTAMQNQIDLAVTETNQSYANSGINQRLRLVHTEEVNYTETGNIETDLTRLTTPADGFIDNAHTLRNTYLADLVALVVEDGGGFCGIANLMTSVSATFESQGFSITARNCATGYYSFGHELGHNMGARHDRYVDPTNNSPFSYNHGYVNMAARWRTVMAYNTQCQASGFNCTRLPYWSNPNVNYGGVPTGIAEGSNNAADNRKTLNNTALTVANFRSSGGTPATVGPLVYNGHTINDDMINDSSGNGNGEVECGETIESFITLLNQGSNTATGINATLSTNSAYVTFPFNTASSYPNIASVSNQANTNDFEFQVAPNTPSGHQIQFNLSVTAGNGGPWNTSFVVPVTCAVTSGDGYEVDNNSTQARIIGSGTGQTHSIYPIGDDDWTTFTLSGPSKVLLETSGTPGDDTVMWLYDSALGYIDDNDDIDFQNGNYFSRIERPCGATALAAGTYYVWIYEYYDSFTIDAYNLNLTVTPCQSSNVYLPVVIKP